MSMYEIARDVAELRARIDQLEGGRSRKAKAEGEREPEIGRIPNLPHTGVDLERPPYVWKFEKGRLPPFAYYLFGVPPDTKFDLLPQAKTWNCIPEPLIINVVWPDESQEEHCRMATQVFSIFKYADPNTGHVTATATYAARFTSTATHSVDWGGGSVGPPYIPGVYIGPVMKFQLTNSGGATMYSDFRKFQVRCSDSNQFTLSFDFPGGLFDLVSGARWQFVPWTVQRC